MPSIKFVLYMICSCLIFSCSFNNPFLPTDELVRKESIQIKFQPGAEATGIMEDLTVTKGSSVALTKNAFSRDGYLFKGWKDSKGNTFSDEQEVTFFDDTILTAQWKPCAFKVIFYANNGTSDYTIKGADYGDNVTLGNTFDYTGHVFTGWNTDKSGSGKSYVNGQHITITENITLYAQWKPGAFSVTYYANNGTKESQTQGADYGEDVAIISNTFVYDGHVFTGWTTDKLGSGKSYTNGQQLTITENVVLYAQWKPVFKVTFCANNGTSDYTTQLADSNGNVTLSNTFSYDGHYFTGWNTDKSGSGTHYANGEHITVTGDITLYAQWESNKITLTAPAGSNYIWSTGATTQSITVPAHPDATYTCTWETEEEIFKIDFENGNKSGWSTDYEPFSTGCDQGSGPRKWENQTNEKPHSGTYCWKFDGATVDINNNKISDSTPIDLYRKVIKKVNLSLEKGSTYELRYWGKTYLPDGSTDEEYKAKLCSYLTYSANDTKKIGDTVPLTSDWAEYSAEVTAKADVSNAMFYMYDEETGKNYNDFWIDDLSFVKIRDSKEFIIESGKLKN